jgi:HTH-type transcriptional regulator/antitoxin HigA
LKLRIIIKTKGSGIMVRSRTLIATPPGASIKEQLLFRGMTQKEFALRMGMTEKHISKLINGDVHLTPDVALRLEMVLGIPAHFWNNLGSIYQEKLLRIRAENDMDADREVAKKIPYREMVKYKWIVETRNIDERVVHLRRFFEVANLALLDQLDFTHIVCRQLKKNEKTDYALLAWAQKAKIEARRYPTKNINISGLKATLPAIRAMILEKPVIFSLKLQELLAAYGVAMIYLPHIGGSFLHGATFYDGTKIVMGLTVRGKTADKFWFSLFHEVGHIVLGHVGRHKICTQDCEIEADNFAKDILIPQQDYDNFIAKKMFSTLSIKEFAENIGVTPGIVVGRLQKDHFIGYDKYNSLKVKYAIF